MLIHLCPLDALDDTLRQRYRDTLLDDDERQRLAQFRRAQAADEFLLGRALLRATLGELLGRDPRRLAIERDADGKPQLRDGDGWRFNLSHGAGHVALALSRDGRVGIDIDSGARRNDIDGIAQRFFRPDEAAWLLSLPPAQRREKFFLLWTVKEAAVKALGCGIAGALIDAGVRCSDEGFALTLHGALAQPHAPRCWHATIGDDSPPRHLAAVLLPDHAAATALSPTLLQTVPLRATQPFTGIVRPHPTVS